MAAVLKGMFGIKWLLKSVSTILKNICCVSTFFPDRDGCSAEVQDRYPASRRRHAAHRHQPGTAVAGVHGQ